MDGRMVAQHALSFIGGTPSVATYHSEDRKKEIDVMRCDGVLSADEAVFSTLGLHAFDFGLTSNGKELRVELVCAGRGAGDRFGNLIASTAFELMDAGRCGYGMLVPGVAAAYLGEGSLRHVLLLSPALWDGYRPLVSDEMMVSWLYALPITDSEAAYVAKYGSDAFERLLEETQVEVGNPLRQSVVP